MSGAQGRLLVRHHQEFPRQAQGTIPRVQQGAVCHFARAERGGRFARSSSGWRDSLYEGAGRKRRDRGPT